MNKKNFKKFLESVRQGADILKSKAKPNRTFDLENPDVKNIRNKLRLSQSKFAKLLGINLATLQNWEQGRRRPVGPARVLLGIAWIHPEVLIDVGHLGKKNAA